MFAFYPGCSLYILHTVYPDPTFTTVPPLSQPQSISQPSANEVCFLAETQVGKTTILQQLAATGMTTYEEYTHFHKDGAIVSSMA